MSITVAFNHVLAIYLLPDRLDVVLTSLVTASAAFVTSLSGNSSITLLLCRITKINFPARHSYFLFPIDILPDSRPSFNSYYKSRHHLNLDQVLLFDI